MCISTELTDPLLIQITSLEYSSRDQGRRVPKEIVFNNEVSHQQNLSASAIPKNSYNSKLRTDSWLPIIFSLTRIILSYFYLTSYAIEYEL